MGFILKVLCFFTNIVAVPLFGFTGVQIVGHIMPFMSTSFIGSIIGNIIDLSIWTILLIITMKQIKSNTNQKSTINQSVQTKFEQNTNQFTDDIFLKLNEYKKLLDIGAITQEEFDRKKKELL